MKLPIVIIGPMAVGKSSVAEILSKKLSLPRCAVDTIRTSYYEKAGLDLEIEEKLRTGEDFWKYVAFIRSYEIDAVEKILRDENFKHSIIDFGAGHTFYEDPEFIFRAKEAFAGIENVILLLPTENMEESMGVLNKRLEEDETDEKKLASHISVNERFIKNHLNQDLAKITVYIKDKTIEQVANEIISKLK